MKPKAVLAYCREKGIRAVDLRFVDVNGKWRHITFPVSALSESSFEEGFGHTIVLDPGVALPIHAILVPHSEANYLDPLTSQPTLVLIASIQDIVTRDESALDTRQLAVRAARYVESASVGDSHTVRARFPFRLRSEPQSTHRIGVESYLSCGPTDLDFNDRCQIADSALESGVHIDRHYCGMNFNSEMVLKPSSLVECCDDIMMLRYLVEQHASKLNGSAGWQDLWVSCQWSISRQSEPILVGAAQRGLSDAGLYAIGGILKHADAIVAIAVSSCPLESYPWQRMCNDNNPDSLCRVSTASHHPRSRAIEFLGVPAICNPYLANSAILMAIVDGIQNKISPNPGLDSKSFNPLESNAYRIGYDDSGEYHGQQLSKRLNEDRDFLSRGEVFSDELLDLLCHKLEQQK